MKKLFVILLCSIFVLPGYSQLSESGLEGGYEFEIIHDVEKTPVKSQGRTGSCWSFATHSFLESELIRLGKGEHDLSEMFVVRNIYIEKAENYVRRQGKANFSQGSLAHDVITIADKYGLMPEDAYTGMDAEAGMHDHSELETLLKGYLDGVIKNKAGQLQSAGGEIKWRKSYEAILDVYLGEVPASFTYQGKKYNSPKAFAKEILDKASPSDYVTVTSYSHHPFYRQFVLEIPDNFSNGLYYNVPLEEMQAITDNALENGYSVSWDCDVSEEEFSPRHGLALVPEKTWTDKNEEEQRQTFEQPEAEKPITQELRQFTFDNYSTTDDHLMHITGVAKDKNGVKYYITKNSWGEIGPYQGYIYASEPYFQLKTISIMVHKDAIPKKIARKMGI